MAARVWIRAPSDSQPHSSPSNVKVLAAAVATVQENYCSSSNI